MITNAPNYHQFKETTPVTFSSPSRFLLRVTFSSPWESLLPNPREIAFDETTLPRLIDLIEQYPTESLFRIEEASAENPQTHPPLKSRILYLWYNREEIHRSGNNANYEFK